MAVKALTLIYPRSTGARVADLVISTVVQVALDVLLEPTLTWHTAAITLVTHQGIERHVASLECVK